MRKLSKISKLKAKHEIDNIMFKFQFEDESNNIVKQMNYLRALQSLQFIPQLRCRALSTNRKIINKYSNNKEVFLVLVH